MTDTPEPAPDEAQAALPEVIYLPDLSPPPTKRKAERQARGEPGKGKHFGPRRVDDPRTAWLTARCTPTFRATVIAAAEAAGLSLADYVHVRLGGSPGPRARRSPSVDTVLLAKTLAEMGKRGSNLNQLARAFNMMDAPAPDELETALTEHRAAVAAIMRALGA